MILPVCKSPAGLERVQWGNTKPHYFVDTSGWCVNLAGRRAHRQEVAEWMEFRRVFREPIG